MKISAVFAFAFVALCAFECCVSVPAAHFKPREDPRDAEFYKQVKHFPREPEKDDCKDEEDGGVKNIEELFDKTKAILENSKVFPNKDSQTSEKGWFWPSRVCYGKYGCFDKHPGVLWGLIRVRPSLPESPSDVGTKFRMYTRNGSGEVNDNDTSTLAKFDITRKRTIFLINGWKDNPCNWQLKVKDELLLREDCNVIVVNWSIGASKNYFQSAGNARLVGAMVGELIKFLISSVNGSPDLAEGFYVVGPSLGAQTAGYAGDYLKHNANITLGRITGLDPAGPLFTNVRDPRFRLDPGDAGYVDVIHTDMPPSRFGLGLGISKKAGHTDFFVNGGVSQPGCAGAGIFAIYKKTFCDHVRSLDYYVASIKNLCSWKAHPCASLAACQRGEYTDCIGECPSMGYSADEPKRKGTFYLKTTSKKPFCGMWVSNIRLFKVQRPGKK